MSITETVNIGSVTPATWEATNSTNIYVGKGQNGPENTHWTLKKPDVNENGEGCGHGNSNLIYARPTTSQSK